MSEHKEPGSGAIFVWIAVLAPVLYLALYFPLLSFAVREHGPSGDVFIGGFYSPLPRALKSRMRTLWIRMDPKGDKLLDWDRGMSGPRALPL